MEDDLAAFAAAEYHRRHAKARERGLIATGEAGRVLRVWRAIAEAASGVRGPAGIDGVGWPEMCAELNARVEKGLALVAGGQANANQRQFTLDLVRLASRIAAAADAWENALTRQPGEEETNRHHDALTALLEAVHRAVAAA